MKQILCKTILLLMLLGSTLNGASNPTTADKVFYINRPNYKLSPHTGMTRQHWIEAGEYLLNGAFSYIHTIDDAMIFPRSLSQCYPHNESQETTAKLEGFCRTLFVAAPLLRENPDLTLNGINVADYYRHHLLQLINPESKSFIKPRVPNSGPSQTLVEFGALAISLFTASNILWEPLTKEQKNKIAHTMLSYGDGPTIANNWRFFNIFILSFFKEMGYDVNEKLMIEYLDKSLEMYRGEGWYNDAPAYDYYSMWGFQMYGSLWAHLYGKKHLPEHAERFMSNLHDTKNNYPYLFNKEGKMMMWGRSICYRFGSTIPLALLSLTNDKTINYGWMRRIASSTLLQFLQHPKFLEDRVPTLGYYGTFAPAVQIYSCRGSVYWCGKAFLSLLLPEEDAFWSATENNGAWSSELKKGEVYNKFQPSTNLMITNYPNSGATEIRSWCYEKISSDWQKFRSGENYNKLAYHSDLLWMADGKKGEVSMNYAIFNTKKEWEVLRLYTFQTFSEGIYRRTAVMESDENIKFQLAEMPLPNGVLRIDKITTPYPIQIRLGHYSLPQLRQKIKTEKRTIHNFEAYTLGNEHYQVAQLPLSGWQTTEILVARDLHPESEECKILLATDQLEGSKIYVTLQLWKKGQKTFSNKELSPVKSISIEHNNKVVKVNFSNNSTRTISFE